MSGPIDHPTLVLSKTVTDTNTENGYRLANLLKYIQDFTQRIKNRGGGDIFGTMGVSMKAISTTM